MGSDSCAPQNWSLHRVENQWVQSWPCVVPWYLLDGHTGLVRRGRVSAALPLPHHTRQRLDRRTVHTPARQHATTHGSDHRPPIWTSVAVCVCVADALSDMPPLSPFPFPPPSLASRPLPPDTRPLVSCVPKRRFPAVIVCCVVLHDDAIGPRSDGAQEGVALVQLEQRARHLHHAAARTATRARRTTLQHNTQHWGEPRSARGARGATRHMSAAGAGLTQRLPEPRTGRKACSVVAASRPDRPRPSSLHGSPVNMNNQRASLL